MMRALMAGLLGALALTAAAAPAWGQRQESPEAMHQRASAMSSGSRDEARKLWDAACSKGYVPSCMALGASYNVGSFFGSPESALLAKAAFSRACDLGHGEGCLKLGDAQTPRGIFAAPKEAQDWDGATAAYRKACDVHNIPTACWKVADILGTERNLKADFRLSLDYTKRACDLKVQKACDNIAIAQGRLPIGERNARVNAHLSKYGEVDGRIAVDETMFALLWSLLHGQDGQKSGRLSNADVDKIMQQIVADGRRDGNERDFLVELTVPQFRMMAVSPAGGASKAAGDKLYVATVSSDRRSGLLALLDLPETLWDQTDRKGTLMRLARASRTPGMEGPVKALIAGKVAEAAATSTVQSGYNPLRPLISDMLGAVQALEANGTLDKDASAGVRKMYHEAIESGIAQSGVQIPRFLYNWMRPI